MLIWISILSALFVICGGFIYYKQHKTWRAFDITLQSLSRQLQDLESDFENHCQDIAFYRLSGIRMETHPKIYKMIDFDYEILKCRLNKLGEILGFEWKEKQTISKEWTKIKNATEGQSCLKKK